MKTGERPPKSKPNRRKTPADARIMRKNIQKNRENLGEYTAKTKSFFYLAFNYCISIDFGIK